ncbi:hypothetical protein [Nocardia terpenica]|uniref:Uncharacterized protein n=1 Tax=Nocardia terpenica TaxID=455432 RepID=A0A291RRN1_9NOCA|nr:hypothetical protein [Nocardia terpenica]ATL69997.1 hypothetical protein CRH09_31245 [Nocardia terpenica]
MRRIAVTSIVSAAAVVVAACGSSPKDNSPASPQPSAVSAAQPCSLRTERTLLIWRKQPGQPDSALRVGDIDAPHCAPTLQTWRDGESKDAGHCSKIAWADDNPGYNENAHPAAPLNEVIAEVGPAC